MMLKEKFSLLLKKIGPVPVFIGVLFFSFAMQVNETIQLGQNIFSHNQLSFARAVAQDHEMMMEEDHKGPNKMEMMTDSMDAMNSTDPMKAPKEGMAVDNIFDDPPEISNRDFIDDTDFSSSEVEILQSLVKRREELRQKERSLEQKEALLAAAEKQLEIKTQELSTLKQEIESLLGKQQKEQQEQIQSLVKMYETMKPKDAARIFDTLEEDILLSVIGQMSERKAAPILANMDSDKARIVTTELAKQKKLPSFSDEP